MKENTCCFTGHRPQSLPWGFRENDFRCAALKNALREEILNMIRENNVRHFISGIALGVDTWAAEIVLELRDKKACPITLECALPCEGQANRWPENDRERYFSIISRCDKKTLLQAHYTADCMHKRNRYMVEHSEFVIAVWNGTPSGTGMTVAYARETGKEVRVIRP